MDFFVRISSQKQNEREAATEIASQIPKEFHNVVMFISHLYDFSLMQQELNKCCGDKVIACSTAGEIDSHGFSAHSITGFAFCGPDIETNLFVIENLQEMKESQFVELKKKSNELNLNRQVNGEPSKSFCLFLIDGLSEREEDITELIGSNIGSMPLVGGSSGDGLNFNKTNIFVNGEFRQNVAILIFVTTNIPFETFKMQHFSTSEKKLVTTEVDAEKRIVQEINGEKAAVAYANALGMNVEQLDAKVFSQYPLALQIADSYFVRSIQQVLPDLSLKFYCAIENGLVLSIADREDLVKNTKYGFESIENHLGKVQGSILFECILRRLEIEGYEETKQKQIFELYEKYKGVGFHTYGEQFGTVHINQTLTGVCFGSK